MLEDGVFIEDGIPFPAAEVRLDFLDEPARGILPTANVQDRLRVEGLGELPVTFATAGQAAIFVRAADIGLTGKEKPDALRRDTARLERFEALRAEGASAMGLRGRDTAPVLVWVAPPASYKTACGLDVAGDRVDILARTFFDGRLQAAFGTRVSISLAAAAALPGTVVSQVARTLPGVPTRIGHAAGVQTVGASVLRREQGDWVMEHATVSRSARCLMSGWVHVPAAASGLR